jgi:hypothetical protein
MNHTTIKKFWCLLMPASLMFSWLLGRLPATGRWDRSYEKLKPPLVAELRRKAISPTITRILWSSCSILTE